MLNQRIMTAPFLTTADQGQDLILGYKSFTHWQLCSLMENELKMYWHVCVYPDMLVLTVFHDVEGCLMDIRSRLKDTGFTARRAGILSRNIIVEIEKP